MSVTRPEARLLLRGLAPVARPGTAAEVGALLQAGIDWTWLVGTAEAHAVTALLFQRLLALAPEHLPEGIAAACAVHAQRQRARNQALCDELLRVIVALRSAGIAVIPFKGPALTQRAYGDLALRRYRDLDFLIREEDALAARRALAALGYDVRNPWTPAQDSASRRYAGQEIFFRKGGVAPVEPHWALAPHTLALALDYAGLWRRATTIMLAGERVACLADEDLMLCVCLHGSKEQWIRLQWICDVAYLIAACPALDWRAVLARATQQGCRRMVLVGLALARDLLAASLPDDIARAIDADRAATALAAQAARSLFEPDRPDISIYALSGFRWRMRERWRDRARYVLRTVLTPREIHFAALRLPDSLFFLYPVVKLVHDYVALPVWSAGRRLARAAPQPRDKPSS